MNKLNLADVGRYVEENIGQFHMKRLEKLSRLRLLSVLRRKNPYLFRAKNILTAEGLVRSVLDAYLSSQEETLFGDFLEGLAVFVGERVHNGYKPATHEFEGLDLIFEYKNTVYIVEIKSGPHWGNSSQIRKMMLNFDAAKTVFLSQNMGKSIIAVNGCCYGKDKNHSKREGAYWKLCGQDFWRFISGDDELYRYVIEPLSHKAKERNEEFEQEYAKIINRFTLQFGHEFCSSDGAIDWDLLIRFVSERHDESEYPF